MALTDFPDDGTAGIQRQTLQNLVSATTRLLHLDSLLGI